LRAGLDNPNQLDRPSEIAFYAHAIFGVPRGFGRATRSMRAFDVMREPMVRVAANLR